MGLYRTDSFGAEPTRASGCKCPAASAGPALTAWHYIMQIRATCIPHYCFMTTHHAVLMPVFTVPDCNLRKHHWGNSSIDISFIVGIFSRYQERIGNFISAAVVAVTVIMSGLHESHFNSLQTLLQVDFAQTARQVDNRQANMQ